MEQELNALQNEEATENTVDTTIEDNIYRLKEMVDEMSRSIDNITNVKIEQQYLIDILIIHGTDRLSDFVKELEAQNKDLDNQIIMLSTRRDQLAAVCEAATDHPECAEIVNKLVYALGVFRR